MNITLSVLALVIIFYFFKHPVNNVSSGLIIHIHSVIPILIHYKRTESVHQTKTQITKPKGPVVVSIGFISNPPN